MNDTIGKIIDKFFIDNEIDREKFGRDGIFFNETGTRCTVIYDNMDSIDKQFIIICLYLNEDKDWIEEKFVHSGYGTGQYYMDGIDAMCDASSYLEH